MFKKFFKWISSGVLNYVKRNGIIKSICNAIQATVLSAGAFVTIANILKRLKAKFMIKWQLRKNKKKFEKDPDDPNAYDDNGYKLTTSEYEAKNKEKFETINKLYTNDNLECVKFIEMHDPKLFKGMDMDHKLMYVVDNELTFEKLMTRYGTDKDSQVRKHIAEENNIPEDQVTNEQLQEFWDEAEELKIGSNSKVQKGYKKAKSKKKQNKEKVINFFTPDDYVKAEKDFGVDAFYTMDPTRIDPILAAQRKRFDECVKYASGYLNWLYVHHKKQFKHNLEVMKGDPVRLWRTTLNKYMTDDTVFETIKREFSGSLELLESEAKGHHTSSRPKITNIEEADYVDKFENILDRLNDIETKSKCNQSTNLVIDEDDDDESEDLFEESDDMDEDDDITNCTFDDNDSILDQLDALREGKADAQNTTGIEAELSTEDTAIANELPEEPTVMQKKSVKLITDEDESSITSPASDGVIYMNLKEYTTANRALKMLDLYSKLHDKEDTNYADNHIFNMLDDADHKNFEVYEHSLEMRNFRQADRMHQLPFKLVPSDYPSKDEGIAAAKQFDTAVKIYGLDAWKDMISQRTEYYQTFFEVDTADKMMLYLDKHPMSHKAKVDLVRMFVENGYEDCVVRVESVEEYYKEAIRLPDDRTQYVVLDDNIDQFSETELSED